MRERPILFSGPMVRAILDGRKTQTRRVVRGVFEHTFADGVRRDSLMEWDGWPTPLPGPYERTPFGAPGDRLWVRETWGPLEGGFCYRADEHPNARPDGGLWRPSIFMPRWASRLTLEVQAVRVERLQEISEDDIAAEGSEFAWREYEPTVKEGRERIVVTGHAPAQFGPRERFATGWNALNRARGFGWDANPWVWVVAFKRVRESPEVRT